jgi:hypothetical protein
MRNRIKSIDAQSEAPTYSVLTPWLFVDNIHIYIYTYICIHTYIYIYTYTQHGLIQFRHYVHDAHLLRTVSSCSKNRFAGGATNMQ